MIWGMGRSEPNARPGTGGHGALHRAQGFEQGQVTEIARRAGLHPATFFRHFADKREVLFWGQAAGENCRNSWSAPSPAPPSAAPDRRGRRPPWRQPPRVQERHEHARQRQAIINAHPGRGSATDQARHPRLGDRRRTAPARRQRPGPRASSPEAGIAPLKVRIRTLGQRPRPPRPAEDHPAVTRRPPGRHRGRVTAMRSRLTRPGSAAGPGSQELWLAPSSIAASIRSGRPGCALR